MQAVLALVTSLVLGDLAPGPWRAYLRSPNGDIPFQLELLRRGEEWTAAITNGAERIEVPDVRVDGAKVEIAFPHYDSRIDAKIERDGTVLSGEWSKRSGADAWKRMAFFATSGDAPRFPPHEHGEDEPTPDVSGRWYVRFSKSKEPAVALFETAANGELRGTFLTSTGDHRYLAGSLDGSVLRLSCFDGAHAFLYEARVGAGAREIDGRFQSGEAWNERWIASRDERASLQGEMSLAKWKAGFALGSLAYPGLDGTLVELDGPSLAGKPRILQLSGSWCPNCQDETAYLAQLERKHREKGLVVLALCFEVTGDRERDAAQAARMRARHGAEYPFLLAGSSDKALAAQAFPALDRVHAFPTTLFVDRSGIVRAVHSGFSGPATGAAHADLAARFERLTAEILEAPADASALEGILLSHAWRDDRQRHLIEISRRADGRIESVAHELTRFDGPTATEPVARGEVVCSATSARIGSTTFVFEPRTKTLLDPSDASHRLVSSARAPFPSIDGQGEPSAEATAALLSSSDPVARREAAYWLVHGIVATQMAPPDEVVPFDPGLAVNLLPLLDDTDGFARATGSWAVGALRLDGVREKLEANLAHGFAPVRIEAARALGALRAREAKTALAARANDLDPRVRAAVAEALRALE